MSPDISQDSSVVIALIKWHLESSTFETDLVHNNGFNPAHRCPPKPSRLCIRNSVVHQKFVCVETISVFDTRSNDVKVLWLGMSCHSPV